MVVVSMFVEPESAIRLLQRNVRAVLNKNDLGIGTLYVSEGTLCWQEKDDVGFQIDYPSISLHAISKDASVYPEECIYVLIDARINLPGHAPPNIVENEESDEESEAEVSELIFVPENPSLLPGIYEAMKICQELNPDPEDVEDDDDHLYEDAMEENMDEYYEIEAEDLRAGGDTGVEELSHRMESNYLNSDFAHRNGSSNGDTEHEEEDQFEDAD
ncbi:hypothetical protein HHI36_020591 [Cryptolaemus montrouzieri]|uniref:Methylosome subunit pICln n=1 Tax=Cryptolaemus montrouzieri TaxID=559131 RepID=A0ABD2NAN5_9CUCU